jgi:hypothetical protein
MERYFLSEVIPKYLNRNVEYLNINVEHIELKYLGIENNKINYQLSFKFNHSLVVITAFNFSKTILYNETLNESYINTLKREVKKQIKNMIETIAEKKSN